MLFTALIRQKAYEHIVYMVRRSLITLVPTVIGLIILLILPLALKWLLDRLFPNLLLEPVVYSLAVLGASLYYLFCILFFYTWFVDFYLDLLVITNDRLIRINQHGMFSRSIFEVDLYQIQDATSEIKGFIPSLFKYGNITIETSGNVVPRVIGEDVTDPHMLRQAIMDLAAEDKRHHDKV
ncbi:MAG: PH domain-containing protein [Candidatus Magasanikbacteria bacterium]|nr:PH domain-containing protein [Candidatus Magasanikbacteria bacterium]